VFVALVFPILRLLFIVIRHIVRQSHADTGPRDARYDQDMMRLLNNNKLRKEALAMKQNGETLRAVDHVLQRSDVELRAARDFVDRL
jgi:hypothetical protein